MARDTRTGAAAPALEHHAALDGLRGASVLAVLAFHAGFSWARGGYLGVSTFFTLSGFLITTLLLAEREATGTIDRRRFWSRRLRRLLPASLLTLGLAVVYGSGVLSPVGFAASDAQLATLRGDVLAALADVANWRFVVDSQSYADLFRAPSPVLQFWSLAIEEQFYLLFPLLVLGLLAVGGGSRRVLAGGLALLALASLASSLFLGYSDDRIYFGTDTRASELLIGALLAVALTHRPMGRDRPSTVVVSGLGLAAAAVTLVGWALVDQTSAWLYDGGFTLYAVVTAGVLLAAVHPATPVRRVLAATPLVRLGRISYGVYLFHWLVFLWLRQEGASSWVVFLGGGTSTVVAAALSYRYLEEPIRRGRRLDTRQAWVLAPACLATLVVATLLVTASPPTPIDFADAREQLLDSAVPVDESDAPQPARTTAAPPPRIAVYGDSTALMIGLGLSTWMQRTGAAIPSGGDTELGCSLARGGERRTVDGGSEANPGTCDDWEARWADAVARDRPDLAVVPLAAWEVVDRRLPGDDRWRSPGDPVYDDHLRAELHRAVDVLASTGATVVFLTGSPVGDGASGTEAELRGEAADPARMGRVNALLAEVVDGRPEAELVDLDRYLAAGDDARLRPDGVHLSPETATQVAQDFLGPALVQVHEARRGAEPVRE